MPADACRALNREDVLGGEDLGLGDPLPHGGLRDANQASGSRLPAGSLDRFAKRFLWGCIIHG
ncbi:hypothetical protein EV292_106193 [Sphingomonas sp. BK235]|nr:hypothetical protein EV292_106193 [Sphingomonas sp. BK235]